MIGNMLETSNSLQGGTGVQNRGKTSNNHGRSDQSGSFMDILAASKKNTQEPSKKENTPDHADQVSSVNGKKPDPTDSKNEAENKDVAQTEQEKPAEQDETANAAELGIISFLPGTIIMPPVSQEVTAAPMEEAAEIISQTTIQGEVSSPEEKLPVESTIIESNQMMNMPKQSAVQDDTVQEVTAKSTSKESDGQIELPTDDTNQKNDLQSVAVKATSESGETQTEQKESRQETVPVPGQPVVSHTEQPEVNTIKFNDSASLLQRQVTQQVTDQIISNIQEKQQQFTLSLHPDRLGQVAVKMLFEGGKVMVQVETHSQLAQHLLSAGATEIKTLLENTGIQVDGVSIEQYMDQRQQDPNDSRNQAQQHNHASNRRAGEGESEMIEEGNVEQIPVSNGLNYSI